jgi:sialate O-acetylesterase
MKRFWLFFLVNLMVLPVAGGIRLPHLISNGMVLQRDKPVKIWGWANSREKITVIFLGKTYITRADAEGEWSVDLMPARAGGPYSMTIAASDTVEIKDILLGDVWFCSGQSNMVLPIERVRYAYPEEVARAENDQIRQFLVNTNAVFTEPQKDATGGTWTPANPATILRFSATAYFFAKSLYEKYHVPIGIINASVGGTPIQAWMSRDALKNFPVYLEEADQCKDPEYISRIMEKEKKQAREWYNTIKASDKGLLHSPPWYDPSFDDSQWPVMTIPSFWEEKEPAQINGVVWFRKTIVLPENFVHKPASLLLGRIVDCDSVYINGVFIGTTSYQYPPRRYNVPGNILKPGENTIVIRVINFRGRGGFIKDKPYQLIAENDTFDLKGEWHYMIGIAMPPLPDQTFFHYKPTGLYNGMIAPFIRYAIKGVVWYQGESNANNPSEYSLLFKNMITDWRKKWGQGDFPFLFVQLPNFMEPKTTPGESRWAELREAQAEALELPCTGMAITIDIGEWNDIHPLNKKDVGKRLALVAGSVAYGEGKLTSSGPLFHSYRINGKRIILKFRNTDGGLMEKNGFRLRQFAVCDSDRNYVWAQAVIRCNRVIVWNDQIPHPVAVRYAWADNPEGANLCSQNGLPASPFRTNKKY